MFTNNGKGGSYVAPFLEGEIRKDVTSIPASQLFPHTIYDNVNDILMLRTGYSFVKDDVIQIDGGDENGGGHSFAQGYFVYALGEPFIEYEQVSYNDDSYSEIVAFFASSIPWFFIIMFTAEYILRKILSI